MGERGYERGLEDEVEIFETEKFEIYLDCIIVLLDCVIVLLDCVIVLFELCLKPAAGYEALPYSPLPVSEEGFEI